MPFVDPVVLLVGAAAVGYLTADARVRRARGRVSRPHARSSFLIGLGALAIALTGPLDGAVDTSFPAHMVQHLVLTMIAAPLLLLGAPLTLTLQAWPGRTRRVVLRVVHSDAARIVANPVVAWALFVGVLWGVHVTGVYDAALRDQWVHELEHVALLTTALLFWMPIVRADPSPSALSYPARILYLFVAMAAMAFLGLVLVSARDPLYATYAQVDGAARAIADQRAGGAIMWAATMLLIVPALAFVLMGWMRADEREARKVDARLAREGGA